MTIEELKKQAAEHQAALHRINQELNLAQQSELKARIEDLTLQCHDAVLARGEAYQDWEHSKLEWMSADTRFKAAIKAVEDERRLNTPGTMEYKQAADRNPEIRFNTPKLVAQRDARMKQLKDTLDKAETEAAELYQKNQHLGIAAREAAKKSSDLQFELAECARKVLELRGETRQRVSQREYSGSVEDAGVFEFTSTSV
jgi:hypothetical protein